MAEGADPASAERAERPDSASSRIKGVLLLLLLFVVVPFAGLAVLWKDRCQETRLRELPTAGGTLVAALITTDCGASMKVATEIRLERREGNATVAKETVLLLAGTTDVPFSWTDEGTLAVEMPAGVDVVKRRGSWGKDVKISFSSTEPPADAAAPPGTLP